MWFTVLALFLSMTSAWADTTWASTWNRACQLPASKIEDYEAAADDIEKSAFLSLSGYAVSPIVPTADSLRATDLEVEFTQFYLGKLQLDRLQEHMRYLAMGQNEAEIVKPGVDGYHRSLTEEHEEFERTVRRLSRVPGLHAMSKLMVARARELDDPGLGYDLSLDIRIPNGLPTWRFIVGVNGGVLLNDFRNEYAEVVKSREPSPLSFFCVLTVIGCYFSLRSPDSFAIRDLLLNPIRLDVRDQNNESVRIPEPILIENP